MREELSIPEIAANASCRFIRFTVLTVEPEDVDTKAAHLGFDIDGCVEHDPIHGTSTAKLTGLTNEVMDWKQLQMKIAATFSA